MSIVVPSLERTSYWVSQLNWKAGSRADQCPWGWLLLKGARSIASPGCAPWLEQRQWFCLISLQSFVWPSPPCETGPSAFAWAPLDLVRNFCPCVSGRGAVSPWCWDQGAAPWHLCVEDETGMVGAGLYLTAFFMFSSATQRDLWSGWVLWPGEGDAHAASDPCQSGLGERHPCPGTGRTH